MPASSRRQHVDALALGAAMLAALPARAQDATETLTPKVTAPSNCGITRTTIDLGTYTPNQETNIDAEGTITYSGCPDGSSVALDLGGASSRFAQATDEPNSSELANSLCSDSQRSSQWYDDNAVETDGSGSMNVYGRIYANQDVSAGDYADSVTNSLTF